jgi:hypothetical protein
MISTRMIDQYESSRAATQLTAAESVGGEPLGAASKPAIAPYPDQRYASDRVTFRTRSTHPSRREPAPDR